MTYTELYNRIMEHIERAAIRRSNNGEIDLSRMSKTDLLELASYSNMLLDYRDQWDFVTEARDASSVLAYLHTLNTAVFFERCMQTDVTEALNDLLLEYHLREGNPAGVMEIIKHCFRNLDDEVYFAEVERQDYNKYRRLYL